MKRIKFLILLIFLKKMLKFNIFVKIALFCQFLDHEIKKLILQGVTCVKNFFTQFTVLIFKLNNTLQKIEQTELIEP